MTDKPKVVCWGSFYKGVIQDFGYNEKATADNARLDFHGRELTIEPLIRLTGHEASRAADKARIAELTEALVRCRHQASYTIGEAEALSNQLHKVREIASAALAQQGKEGGV